MAMMSGTVTTSDSVERRQLAMSCGMRRPTNKSQAGDYEESQRLRALGRRVHRIEDLPAEIAEVIQSSKMNSAHNHLNAPVE
jgi:hypothetical protein